MTHVGVQFFICAVMVRTSVLVLTMHGLSYPLYWLEPTWIMTGSQKWKARACVRWSDLDSGKYRGPCKLPRVHLRLYPALICSACRCFKLSLPYPRLDPRSAPSRGRPSLSHSPLEPDTLSYIRYSFTPPHSPIEPNIEYLSTGELIPYLQTRWSSVVNHPYIVIATQTEFCHSLCTILLL